MSRALDTVSTTAVPEQSEVRPLALKVPAVARALQCSQRLVWSLIEAGELPSIEIGGARRVRVIDLEGYLDRLAGGDLG